MHDILRRHLLLVEKRRARQPLNQIIFLLLPISFGVVENVPMRGDYVNLVFVVGGKGKHRCDSFNLRAVNFAGVDADENGIGAANIFFGKLRAISDGVRKSGRVDEDNLRREIFRQG